MGRRSERGGRKSKLASIHNGIVSLLSFHKLANSLLSDNTVVNGEKGILCTLTHFFNNLHDFRLIYLKIMRFLFTWTFFISEFFINYYKMINFIELT